MGTKVAVDGLVEVGATVVEVGATVVALETKSITMKTIMDAMGHLWKS